MNCSRLEVGDLIRVNVSGLGYSESFISSIRSIVEDGEGFKIYFNADGVRLLAYDTCIWLTSKTYFDSSSSKLLGGFEEEDPPALNLTEILVDIERVERREYPCY